MSQKILFLYPGKPLRDLANPRDDVVILDSQGWSFKNRNQPERKFLNIFDLEPSYKNFKQKEIMHRLRSVAPTWTRWTSGSDQTELLLREALIYIAYICEGLRYFRIKKVIFPTSISHHLDTAFIEIASSISNIPQIFLYCCPISPRLIPFIQRNSVADRIPLDIEFSNFDFKDSISDFLENKITGKIPRSSIYFGNKINRTPLIAVLCTYYLRFKSFASGVTRRLKKNEKTFFDVFPIYSTKEDQRLIWRQKRALDYYFKNCIGQSELTDFKKKAQQSKKPLPLIAAHFQPEATSFPEGGDLFNHIDIAIELRAIGYEGPIFYKEHFGSTLYFERVVGMTRVGMYRSEDYYKQLVRLGCVFLPLEMELCLDPMKNFWYVPVTIGGSIGIERSLVGLPTIYTGHPWYKGMPGMVPVEKALNFLNGSKCAAQSVNYSRQAQLFLQSFLSRKTLINALGIGTGKPISDDVSIKIFQNEFEVLLRELLKS